MPKKQPAKERKKTQHEKFVELARESGADESERAFIAKVKAISSSEAGKPFAAQGKKMRRLVVIGVCFAFIAHPTFALATCLKLKYGPVTVTGHVFKRTDCGPPNWDTAPCSKVTNLYIRVDHPFCVDADPAFYGNVEDTHVRIMQIIFTRKISPQFVGKHVSVAGEIYPWDNAYKTTPVGLYVKVLPRALPK